MSAPDPAKEKKQRLLLGALLVVVVIVAISRLGGMGGETGEEGEADPAVDLEALQSELYRAESQVKRADQIRRQRRETASELEQLTRLYLPPRRNPFAWATDRINEAASAAGIQIERISLINRPPTIPTVPANATEKPTLPRFMPYQVSVRTLSSYQGLWTFIHEMERSNPYLVVNRLAINANSSKPEKHICEVVLEWPRPEDPLEPTP